MCLICKSPVKSLSNEIMDVFFNASSAKYPEIPLGYAFGCHCVSEAHNKCLVGLKACPLCGKTSVKPNLCVKTWLDDYCYYLFRFYQTFPKYIYYTQVVAVFFMFFCFGFSYLCPEPFKIYCFLAVVVSSILIIGFLNYAKTHWLYDEITYTFGEF